VKKRILTLSIALALVVTMLVPVAALATNEAGQGASTFSGTIEIVSKHTDDAVDIIGFPPAQPGTTVSWPFNFTDWDPATDPPPPDWQVLDPSNSEPVARLKNNSAGELLVWLQVSDWTSGVVVAEYYELVDTTDTTVAVVDDVLSPDGGAYMVVTNQTIASAAYKALYLEVDLSTTPGLSGGSLLTVLGSTP